MSQPILDLGNSANWDAIWSQAASGTTTRPIDPVTVPFLIEQHIIAVLVSSSAIKPTWKWGGYLSKRIRLGLTVGGLPDTDSVNKRKLFVNRVQLFIFPQLSPDYGLEVEFPKWFTSVNLNVWAYTGSIGDTTEQKIEQLQVTVDEINAKLP